MESILHNEITLNIRDAMKLAFGLWEDQHFSEAERLFRAVVELRPDNFDAINGVGVCLAQDENRHEEALQWFDRAFNLIRNELVSLTSNRASSMAALGRTDEALSLLNNLIKTVPEYKLLRYNRGLLLMQYRKHDEAIADFDLVLSVDPKDHLARFARAFAYLASGRYEEGFRDYETRLKDEIDEPDAELWTGEQDINGKSILVHADQGTGDNIMFMRFIPMLVERGADVYVMTNDNIRPLTYGLKNVTIVNGDHATWPKLDYWVRFMSLAYCFKCTVDTVPPPIEMKYDPKLLLHWQRIIRTDHKRLKIGVCWTGGLKSKYDRYRSVPLEYLRPLVQLKGMEFISLQQGVRESDRAAFNEFTRNGWLRDIEDKLTDLGQTAHAMAYLDIVLTVDTSVAHLGGVVGVPTWVMLTSYRTYWLWIEKYTHSPWYPSIRLYHQEMGDGYDCQWAPLIERISNELRGLLAVKAA